MTLDMRTLLVLLALAALLMTFTLAVGARHCRGGGIEKWNIGMGLIAIGWTLMLGRGNLPSIVTVSAANALLLAGLCVQMGALMELGGRPAPRWIFLAPPLLHFALLTALALEDFMWMTLVNACAYVPAFVASALLVRRLPYAARRIMAGAFGIGALVVSARAFEIWAGPESHAGLFSESTAQTVTFATMFMMTLVNPFAFLIMQRERAEAQGEQMSRFAAIAATVESRIPHMNGHQRRVADLAVAIAREMGLSARAIDGVRFGARIHDIGLKEVPAEILAKPMQLTKLEFELVKSHTQAGDDMVKGVEFPWPVAAMVHQHHERLDGSGYPQGLKGDAIAIEARILAVADVVEAMTSHRPYRPALGIDAALKEIGDKRGRHFDANVVDACVRLFREGRFSLESATRPSEHKPAFALA